MHSFPEKAGKNAGLGNLDHLLTNNLSKQEQKNVPAESNLGHMDPFLHLESTMGAVSQPN